MESPVPERPLAGSRRWRGAGAGVALTVNELEALVDCAAHSPALPSSHPFAGVQDIYWSSTTPKYFYLIIFLSFLNKAETAISTQIIFTIMDGNAL